MALLSDPVFLREMEREFGPDYEKVLREHIQVVTQEQTLQPSYLHHADMERSITHPTSQSTTSQSSPSVPTSNYSNNYYNNTNNSNTTINNNTYPNDSNTSYSATSSVNNTSNTRDRTSNNANLTSKSALLKYIYIYPTLTLYSSYLHSFRKD
jgi:hypothetical protein